jgi:uncharacterized membrane protein
MEKVKKVLNEIFIDGLSGMATGLFATLIVGTIIQQIGNLIPGAIGDYLFFIGKVAAAATGAGIGVGTAQRFQASPLVVVSAAVSGMGGAFASKIIAGTFLVDGVVNLAGPGEPLGAFIAAIVTIYFGRLVSGKTKVDILITPLVCIVTGSAVGLILGPPISAFMTFFDGNYCIRSDGNNSDSANQLGSIGGHSQSVRSGSRCSNGRVLCQYGRLCGCKLS